MIVLKNISKYYKSKAAVKDINLEFEPGVIYGLLGRNGAGKTTLINIITNRIFATKGQVFVDGENATENDSAQSKIFCMTDKNSYPGDLKVKDGLKWIKGFYENFDLDYAKRLCGIFGLDVKKRTKALSTGYNSIFKLILTLASGAEIMIFDEPVLGLDANFRDVFYKELLSRFAELKNTMIISTHLIEEISAVLGRVVIIDNGKIILNTSSAELKEYAYVISGDKEKVEKFIKNRNIIHKETLGSYLVATIKNKATDEDLKEIKSLKLDLSAPKLQELFINLTNKENC
ncbi:MAG: ABC transporter ATP-binding protein [Clostridia bacterium]|jgi:ABC-2 type transport system ATP-binding protein|nr:ABC transporter ATP-binding protein [Clostridia bacterium]